MIQPVVDVSDGVYKHAAAIMVADIEGIRTIVRCCSNLTADILAALFNV
jgi:hypothetical protein